MGAARESEAVPREIAGRDREIRRDARLGLVPRERAAQVDRERRDRLLRLRRRRRRERDTKEQDATDSNQHLSTDLEQGTWNPEPGTWNLEPGTWNLEPVSV